VLGYKLLSFAHNVHYSAKPISLPIVCHLAAFQKLVIFLIYRP